MEAAKAAAHQLVHSYPGEIALMTYEDCDGGGDPMTGGIHVVVDFTRDLALLDQKIDELTPEDSTPIADAIDEGVTYLKQKGIYSAKIVVITDGEETCGGNVEDAIRDAIRQGYSVRIIGFGLDSTTEQELRQEVTQAGAQFFSAQDPHALSIKLQQAAGGNDGSCCCSSSAVAMAFVIASLYSWLRKEQVA